MGLRRGRRTEEAPERNAMGGGDGGGLEVMEGGLEVMERGVEVMEGVAEVAGVRRFDGLCIP